jgi:predicted Zn-dependent peptidase
MYGSIDHANEYPDRIAAVTTGDIMRAVKKYITDDNRTVARLLPRPAEKTAGGEK